MPGGDRTGPMGMGPMTSRRAGYCTGYGVPVYTNPRLGRGFGMGFMRGRGFAGRGRRYRYWFHATGMPGCMRFGGYPTAYQEPSREMEKQALRNQADALQSEFESIEKRLSEIQAGTMAE